MPDHALLWKDLADTVLATMRIVYGSRIFNIHDSENMEERNRIIVLSASEGMNDG